MTSLGKNHYGERAVRFLRVRKSAGLDEVAEWETDVFLESDLVAPFQSEDNSSVASSAAIKNAILALACDVGGVPRDGFALSVADRFLSHYENVTSCEVEVREKLWTRLAPEGRPHPFFFIREAIGTPFSKVRRERGKTAHRSAGIRGITMMKTAEHGLSAFREPEFASRTQPVDGVLATSLDAEWEYSADSDDLEAVVVDLMLEVFGETYSSSVQRALFQMGEAALETFSDLSRIRLSLSSKHYLGFDAAGLGRPSNRERIFLPTDDPFGCVEAVVARNEAGKG